MERALDTINGSDNYNNDDDNTALNVLLDACPVPHKNDKKE